MRCFAWREQRVLQESSDGAVVKGARLPLMWPGFDSRTRRHMWVEFVVGSHPCSEGFLLVLRFSPSPKKQKHDESCVRSLAWCELQQHVLQKSFVTAIIKSCTVHISFKRAHTLCLIPSTLSFSIGTTELGGRPFSNCITVLAYFIT